MESLFSQGSITTDLTHMALTMAVQQRQVAGPLLHHSDRGSQYTAGQYQQQLLLYGLQCSMSRPGHSLPYVVQCAPDVGAPMSTAPPARPATIFVSISKDETTAWFSATVLSHQIGRQAVWLKRDGQPLVVTQRMKLDP